MKKKTEKKKEHTIIESNLKSPTNKKKKQLKTPSETLHPHHHHPKANHNNVLFSSVNCLKKYKSLENIADCMPGKQGDKYRNKTNHGNNIENKTQRYEKV